MERKRAMDDRELLKLLEDGRGQSEAARTLGDPRVADAIALMERKAEQEANGFETGLAAARIGLRAK